MEEYESPTVEVICGVKVENCICGLPVGHPENEPHVCYSTDECGGQWFGDDEMFTPIIIPALKFPTPFTYEYHISKKGEAK